MKARILVVDDDSDVRRALADRLSHWGHSCEEVGAVTGALAALASKRFDLVLLDLSLPDGSGLDVLERRRDEPANGDVIVLTAHGSVQAAVEAIRAGAVDFLQKPADFELLRAVVERTLERQRLQRVNRALEERIGEPDAAVLGSSAAMRELIETARRAASSHSTVLLTGESGSGKQVLAEFLHRHSPRRDAPFVYVNCVSISDELVESTLFGHEKGAFTGAVQQKRGRLEAAAGGTAFLDEIGDVSLGVQAKLLHFLESGEFERVGGTRTLDVDCRIVAATNRDLETAVREGDFREDLYFRLNVIRLRVPPLRDRVEDIPVLAGAFLERLASELARARMEFDPRTIDVMKAYAWPGNVRQLRNAVERMAVLAPGSRLTPDLLPPEVLEPPAVAAGPPGAALADRPLREAMEEYKRRYIAAALSRTGGNQTKAAALLGVQRSHLNRLIKESGLG